MSLALEKIEKIKRLRAKGLSYPQISKAVNVSGGSAYRYGRLVSQEKAKSMYETRNSCIAWNNRKNIRCCRSPGHKGVHMSDETGKLIYWE